MTGAVAIVSGGMDSVTLLHFLFKRKRISPAVLSFVYGQKHSREVECAKKHAQLLGCPAHLIVDLSAVQPLFAHSALISPAVRIPDFAEVAGDPQPPTYVPNRNMIFLALAAAYAETHGMTAVYYGAQQQDLYGYWDTTPQFVNRLNHVFSLNRGQPVQIQAPFAGSTKAEVLRLGIELGVDYAATWSCYQGHAETACGRCPTCVERLNAFAEAGLPDPLPYSAGQQ